jgi:hypothetical protein
LTSNELFGDGGGGGGGGGGGYYSGGGDDDRINIDDLYEKKQQQDLKQLNIFTKILNRIHRKIKDCAKKTTTMKYIWFIVPEYLFGEPLYDQGECLGFLVDKLETNGFVTRYIHPNALYISWSHWVPYYVRDEYKRKTGISIDENGNVVERGSKSSSSSSSSSLMSPNDHMLRMGGGGSGAVVDESDAAATGSGNSSSSSSTTGTSKKFTSIKGFRPQNMIYREDLLAKMNKKFM